eukprot:GHVP01017154.1.p1 GENE.GHVP01017154.1~~GHVP01017154.1.p1  ORF type:complete len:142 (+),score=19.32 GHVP01017154.1:65-490(+)
MAPTFRWPAMKVNQLAIPEQLPPLTFRTTAFDSNAATYRNSMGKAAEARKREARVDEAIRMPTTSEQGQQRGQQRGRDNPGLDANRSPGSQQPHGPTDRETAAVTDVPPPKNANARKPLVFNLPDDAKVPLPEEHSIAAHY